MGHFLAENKSISQREVVMSALKQMRKLSASLYGLADIFAKSE